MNDYSIKVSPEKTFVGFDWVEFLKGNRKVIISMLVSGLSLLITNESTVSLVAGMIFAMGYTGLEFYFNEVKLKK